MQNSHSRSECWFSCCDVSIGLCIVHSVRCCSHISWPKSRLRSFGRKFFLFRLFVCSAWRAIASREILVLLFVCDWVKAVLWPWVQRPGFSIVPHVYSRPTYGIPSNRREKLCHCILRSWTNAGYCIWGSEKMWSSVCGARYSNMHFSQTLRTYWVWSDDINWPPDLNAIVNIRHLNSQLKFPLSMNAFDRHCPIVCACQYRSEPVCKKYSNKFYFICLIWFHSTFEFSFHSEFNCNWNTPVFLFIWNLFHVWKTDE